MNIKFKLVAITFFVSLLSSASLTAQVGINLLSPHPSSAMQIVSPSGTYRGLLTPSMTSINRAGIQTGTLTLADGLIVYDTDHHMHYHYNTGISKWVSMSPFILSTPPNGSTAYPSGFITTPSAPLAFSVGINKQTPTAALDVVGNTNISGSLSVNGFPINALVPAGAIIMYNGTAPPAGWALCDGTLGTPDLRGRFIVSSGQATTTTVPGDLNPSYTSGNKGGENRHILSKGEIPKHYHESNTDGANIYVGGGAHNHDVTPHGQGLNAQRAGGQAGGLASDGTATIGTTTNTHTHFTSDFGGKVGNGTTDGLNDQAHENRPLYYALTFIMKL